MSLIISALFRLGLGLASASELITKANTLNAVSDKVKHERIFALDFIISNQFK